MSNERTAGGFVGVIFFLVKFTTSGSVKSPKDFSFFLLESPKVIGFHYLGIDFTNLKKTLR